VPGSRVNVSLHISWTFAGQGLGHDVLDLMGGKRCPEVTGKCSSPNSFSFCLKIYFWLPNNLNDFVFLSALYSFFLIDKFQIYNK